VLGRAYAVAVPQRHGAGPAAETPGAPSNAGKKANGIMNAKEEYTQPLLTEHAPLLDLTGKSREKIGDNGIVDD
jgi:hypothetical protein